MGVNRPVDLSDAMVHRLCPTGADYGTELATGTGMTAAGWVTMGTVGAAVGATVAGSVGAGVTGAAVGGTVTGARVLAAFVSPTTDDGMVVVGRGGRVVVALGSRVPMTTLTVAPGVAASPPAGVCSNTTPMPVLSSTGLVRRST